MLWGVQWHLGSLYNDSEKFGGISSSPVTHGFDDFNSTLMVAPTATTNCKVHLASDSLKRFLFLSRRFLD